MLKRIHRRTRRRGDEEKRGELREGRRTGRETKEEKEKDKEKEKRREEENRVRESGRAGKAPPFLTGSSHHQYRCSYFVVYIILFNINKMRYYLRVRADAYTVLNPSYNTRSHTVACVATTEKY